MSQICTSYDSYLQDQDKAVWIAELSDGTQVFCDDGRYGEKDIAWARLRKYLKNSGLRIAKLLIKFRSHTELVAERNEDTVGFYFGRAVSAWVGQPTINYMVVGVVQKSEQGELAHTTKWRVPEIIEDEKDTRNPSDYLENIIWDCSKVQN